MQETEARFYDKFGKYQRIPEWIYEVEGVGLKDVQLYGIIMRYGAASGTVYKSNSALAAMIGATERTVQRSLHFLADVGAIRVEIKHGYQRCICPLPLSENMGDTPVGVGRHGSRRGVTHLSGGGDTPVTHNRTITIDHTIEDNSSTSPNATHSGGPVAVGLDSTQTAGGNLYGDPPQPPQPQRMRPQTAQSGTDTPPQPAKAAPAPKTARKPPSGFHAAVIAQWYEYSDTHLTLIPHLKGRNASAGKSLCERLADMGRDMLKHGIILPAPFEYPELSPAEANGHNHFRAILDYIKRTDTVFYFDELWKVNLKWPSLNLQLKGMKAAYQSRGEKGEWTGKGPPPSGEKFSEAQLKKMAQRVMDVPIDSFKQRTTSL